METRSLGLTLLAPRMLRNVHERVDVEGPKFVGAQFVLASPAGVGAVLTAIPIVGRREMDLEPQSA